MRFKRAILLLCSVLMCNHASLASSDCVGVVELLPGLRQDTVSWKAKHVPVSSSSEYCDSFHIPRSKVKFDDLDFYTLTANATWMSSCCYLRFSGTYGSSHQGKMKETLALTTSLLSSSFDESVHPKVKRRNQAVDLDAAWGYPLAFCCGRLSIVPLLGVSYHHLNLHTKDRGAYPSCCSSSSSSSDSCCFSSSSFPVDECYNAFPSSVTENPFLDSSSENFRDMLGIENCHRTSTYRFSLCALYLGCEFAYGCGSPWTLFGELDLYLFGRATRERKSYVGISKLDHYHKAGSTHGVQAKLGANYDMGGNWYSTLLLNFNGWRSESHRDTLFWRSYGVELGLGYIY